MTPPPWRWRRLQLGLQLGLQLRPPCPVQSPAQPGPRKYNASLSGYRRSYKRRYTPAVVVTTTSLREQNPQTQHTQTHHTHTPMTPPLHEYLSPTKFIPKIVIDFALLVRRAYLRVVVLQPRLVVVMIGDLDPLLIVVLVRGGNVRDNVRAMGFGELVLHLRQLAGGQQADPRSQAASEEELNAHYFLPVGERGWN